MFLAALALAAIVACGGGGDGDGDGYTIPTENDPDLVGTWELATYEGETVPCDAFILELGSSNYTYTDGSESCQETGTYVAEFGTIITTVTVSTCDPNDVGETEQIGYSVSGDTLTITDPDDTVLVFTKNERTDCGTTASYATDVQPVFTASCIGCHAGVYQTVDMDLRSGASWGEIVNQPSTGTDSASWRVLPFDSASSALYQRISGVGLATGEDQMPLAGAPLAAETITTIQTWIDAGAPNN
jgi:hypothetical protein